MSGCCCGGGTIVLNGSAAPKVDPAECNALTQSADGLFVPETEIVGIAPGGNVSEERSVDIDITPPADGACPEVWTVGARLTPVYGSRAAGMADLRTSALGEAVPLPNSEVSLPEPGVYRLTAHLFALATWNFDGRHIASISAQWYNTATDAAVPGSARWVILHDEPGTLNPETNLKSIGGSSVAEAFVTIAAPTTFGIRGYRATADGGAQANANIQHFLTGGFGNQQIMWQKVAD